MKKKTSTTRKTKALNKADVKHRGTTQEFYASTTDSNYDTAKKRRFIKSGHVWKTDEDGIIDIFGNGSDRHNGPECVKCGYNTCWHCCDKPPKCPCA